MFRLLLLLILTATSCYGAGIPGYRRGLAPRLDGRIVGGVETTIQEFPHQISMWYFGSHRCGGAICARKVILTAAHCVNNIPPDNFVVVTGATSRLNGGLEHTVKEIIAHGEFNPYEYDNDIALMILHDEMEFSSLRQPIALARKGETVRAGTKALVSGWGTLTSGSGDLPTNLQYVSVSIVSNADCAKAYEDVNPVSDSMMCAGEPYGGRDACQGDSGGPLIVGKRQYGIVSWGLGCAEPGYPGAYANVANLRDWIDLKASPFIRD